MKPDSLEERHGESLIANCRKPNKYKPLFDEAKNIYQVGFSMLEAMLGDDVRRRKFDDEFAEITQVTPPLYLGLNRISLTTTGRVANCTKAFLLKWFR